MGGPQEVQGEPRIRRWPSVRFHYKHAIPGEELPETAAFCSGVPRHYGQHDNHGAVDQHPECIRKTVRALGDSRAVHDASELSRLHSHWPWPSAPVAGNRQGSAAVEICVVRATMSRGRYEELQECQESWKKYIERYALNSLPLGARRRRRASENWDLRQAVHPGFRLGYT